MGNTILYVTYIQNGTMKRAVISQKQYNSYRQDSTIQDLNIHGSQSLMEAHYNNVNNINKPVKQILHG